MSRRTKQKTEFGRRLRKAREAKGLTLDRVAVQVQDRMGQQTGTSRETVRRYELAGSPGGITEDSADLVVTAILAEIYGVTLQWLSPTVARRAALARELFSDVVLGCKEPPRRTTKPK